MQNFYECVLYIMVLICCVYHCIQSPSNRRDKIQPELQDFAGPGIPESSAAEKVKKKEIDARSCMKRMVLINPDVAV